MLYIPIEPYILYIMIGKSQDGGLNNLKRLFVNTQLSLQVKYMHQPQYTEMYIIITEVFHSFLCHTTLINTTLHLFTTSELHTSHLKYNVYKCILSSL